MLGDSTPVVSARDMMFVVLLVTLFLLHVLCTLGLPDLVLYVLCSPSQT